MRMMYLFIMWIFMNMFSCIRKKNNDFRYTLEHSPWEGVFFWCIVSLLTSLAALLILTGIQTALGVNIPVQVWFGYMISCVLYLLYSGVSVMYNTFKAERAELFETIKNGR